MKVYKEEDGRAFCSEDSSVLVRIASLRCLHKTSFATEPDIIEMTQQEYNELRTTLKAFLVGGSMLLESDRIFGMKIVVSS